MGSTWGQHGVNLGSKWGQPGINLGSTWGQPAPAYLVRAPLRLPPFPRAPLGASTAPHVGRTGARGLVRRQVAPREARLRAVAARRGQQRDGLLHREVAVELRRQRAAARGALGRGPLCGRVRPQLGQTRAGPGLRADDVAARALLDAPRGIGPANRCCSLATSYLYYNNAT
jgi:hypothetical protein